LRASDLLFGIAKNVGFLLNKHNFKRINCICITAYNEEDFNSVEFEKKDTDKFIRIFDSQTLNLLSEFVSLKEIATKFKGPISNISAVLSGKREKASGKPKRHSRAFTAAHSISLRATEVTTRETIGHLEGDCVVGPKGDGSTILYIMTERSTKLEIIRKINSRKKTEIVKVLDTLEKVSGSGKFKTMFNTITYDNGVEFSDGEGMMKSVLTKGKDITKIPMKKIR